MASILTSPNVSVRLGKYKYIGIGVMPRQFLAIFRANKMYIFWVFSFVGEPSWARRQQPLLYRVDQALKKRFYIFLNGNAAHGHEDGALRARVNIFAVFKS